MSTEIKKHTFDHKIFTIHRLRINVKSLAEEARIIRKEAKRCSPLYRDGLTNHRRNELRFASRIAQLALAYVRGKKYREVEWNASYGFLTLDGFARVLFTKLSRLCPYNTVKLADVTAWLLEGSDA